jgi:hypothetical protein
MSWLPQKQGIKPSSTLPVVSLQGTNALHKTILSLAASWVPEDANMS